MAKNLVKRVEVLKSGGLNLVLDKKVLKKDMKYQAEMNARFDALDHDQLNKDIDSGDPEREMQAVMSLIYAAHPEPKHKKIK